MKRLRDQLLAGAAFTLQQNGRTARRYLCNQVEEPQHRLALADDVFEVVALLERPFELHDLFFSAMAGDGRPNVGEQLLIVPRLLYEVLGACANRIDDIADGAESGDHDDRQVWLRLRNSRQQVDTRLPRQRPAPEEQTVLIAQFQLHPPS